MGSGSRSPVALARAAQNHAIQTAAGIIDGLCISDPSAIDVAAIAYLRDLLVEEGELNGAQGRLVIRGKQGKARVSSAIPELGRRRFVAAHEFGHFELHKDRLSVFNCKDEYFDLWRVQNPAIEREANAFASELLMPGKLFGVEAISGHPNWSLIDKLVDRYQSSRTATALRYLEFTNEPCALVCSESDSISWASKSKSFTWRIERNKRLSEESLAHDYFSGHGIPGTPEQIFARAWLTSPQLIPGARLVEHSFAMPKYGIVMSLLWVNDIVESDEDHDINDNFNPDGKRYSW